MDETTEKLWTHDFQQNELKRKGGDSKYLRFSGLTATPHFITPMAPKQISGTPELTSSVPAVVPTVTDAVKN